MDLAKFFTALDPNQVALGGVVTFMVFSLIRGWVVPRSVLVDIIADKDAQINAVTKERDAWHSAHTVSEETRVIQRDQIGTLIRAAEVGTHMAETLRESVSSAVRSPSSTGEQ